MKISKLAGSHRLAPAKGGHRTGGIMAPLDRVRARARAARELRKNRHPGHALKLLLALLILLALINRGISSAEPSAAEPYQATTSREARDSAIQLVPIEKLDAEARKKVASVLSTTNIFRRLPVHVTRCDPDLYLFLVRHPDVVVGIWEELKISDLRIQQTGPGVYRGSDGEGTVGTVEFLYQDHDTHIVYTEGQYNGPLLANSVQGRSLVILKTGYIREPDGQYYITSRLDTFTQIDNAGIEFLTRTFQPVIGKVADSNFVQTSAFVGSLSRTAEVNHRGVQRLAGNLQRVQPEVRKEFAVLAKQVADKSAGRLLREPPADLTLARKPTVEK